MFKTGQRSKVKGQRGRLSFQLSAFSFQLILFLLASTATAGTVDRIVAVVNGEIVTASELDQATAMHQRNNKGAGKQSADLSRSEVLDKLIDELLLKNSIEKAKITVEDEEVARAIGNILQQNRMTPEQLKADLASKGVTYETYKYQVAHQIRFIKFTNQVVGQQIKLSDRELRDYYDRNRDRFGGASSTFETVREQVYDSLYEERMEEAMRSYLLAQRQKAYIDIR